MTTTRALALVLAAGPSPMAAPSRADRVADVLLSAPSLALVAEVVAAAVAWRTFLSTRGLVPDQYGTPTTLRLARAVRALEEA